MMPYPHIDPVALQLGPVSIRWYGLAYVAGFLCGLKYMLWQVDQGRGAPLTRPHVDNLFAWVILGILLGGRLGYVLFYNLAYYFEHPLHILFTWQGGMSYHGGLLGVITATLLFCWRYQLNFTDVMDKIAPCVPLGLFFGRLANFINGELYGRVTTVPWGMVFPHGGPLPRHPSQLYEAVLEGLVLFALLHVTARRSPPRFTLSGLFLVGYGVFRFGVEFFRQPDDLPELHGPAFQFLSMGQWLSLPMIVLGLILLGLAYSRRNQHVAA